MNSIIIVYILLIEKVYNDYLKELSKIIELFFLRQSKVWDPLSAEYHQVDVEQQKLDEKNTMIKRVMDKCYP